MNIKYPNLCMKTYTCNVVANFDNNTGKMGGETTFPFCAKINEHLLKDPLFNLESFFQHNATEYARERYDTKFIEPLVKKAKAGEVDAATVAPLISNIGKVAVRVDVIIETK